ncbi:MAG: tetratricopeptide repeat protein [Archangium sp.]|nr:tetratricopeptide repeat protein [Archangium sp.]
MDKNKIIEAAAKLVAKGAYDKAIKEYQRVLEVDPKDVRILQKMGELFQKKNDNPQAAVYFTKVAESYATDGFFLKAVALYKQVLKLDPTLMDLNIKLAELHQQLQLMGEAMAYYQIVANHYDKAGDTRKSLDVLKKMVDLDPDNVPSRVKLADLYVREGLNQEAVAEFQRAAEHLKRQNSVDDYLRVAERISALEPNDLPLHKELAELYLQRNDQKRALAKLQVCFKADPRDVDTLRLLATAFQGLGQTSKTVSVYKELARAYESRGQNDEAEQVWQHVAQLDPNDPDVAARNESLVSGSGVHVAGSGVHGAVAVSSKSSGTMQALPRSSGSQPSIAGQAPLPNKPEKPRVDSIAKLLTETDVYVKYGLHDKALEHLRKIFSNDPENIDAHEKAYAIYVASNNQAQAFEQLLNVLRLHTRRGDAQRAQPYLQAVLQQNPGHPEVPAFLAALRVAGGDAVEAPTGSPSEVADDAILVDSSDDEVIIADEPHDALEPEPADMVAAEDVAPAPDDGELVLAGEDSQSQAFADASPPPVWDSQDEPLVAPGTLGDDTAVTGEFSAVEEHGAPPWATPTAEPVTSSNPALTRGGASPLGESGNEEPTRGIRIDRSMFANLESPPSKLRQSVDLTPEVPALEDPDPFAAQGGEEPVEAPPVEDEEAVEAPPEDEPAAEECDEATFFLEQGLYEEAREILETILIAYPEHQRASRLMAQLEAGEAGGGAPVEQAVPSSGSFDLAHELAEELDTSAAPAAADEYQVPMEEVFSEFKKAVEKVVKPEDVETHYDLGIAYKEMMLVDDAINEFMVARRGCVGKRKEVDCLTMIGMLQVMKGDFPGAIDAYMQALASEHATGDVEKAARYELATAYEGAGQAGKALAQFMRVERVDGAYREVAANVQRLSAMTSPEDDAPAAPKPPSKGRKVGYV